MSFQEEWHIQVAVVQWLMANYKDALFTASAGGMRTSIGTAVKMKRSGYMKGTPDLMIFEPVGRYHGCFVELKTKVGKLSSEQEDFLRRLAERGYAVKVARGFNEAIDWIDSYIKGAIQ